MKQRFKLGAKVRTTIGEDFEGEIVQVLPYPNLDIYYMVTDGVRLVEIPSWELEPVAQCEVAP